MLRAEASKSASMNPDRFIWPSIAKERDFAWMWTLALEDATAYDYVIQ